MYDLYIIDQGDSNDGYFNNEAGTWSIFFIVFYL